MCTSIVDPFGLGTLLSQICCSIGDIFFSQQAALGNALHCMAVAIPSGKIHLDVYACRIGAECLLDNARSLHKLFPVHGIKKTKTSDTISNGDLIYRRLLYILLDQMYDALSCLGEALFDPD